MMILSLISVNGLITWVGTFLLQMSNSYQCLVCLAPTWKQEWVRLYVHGGMAHAFLRPLMLLKFLHEIQRVLLGKVASLPQLFLSIPASNFSLSWSFYLLFFPFLACMFFYMLKLNIMVPTLTILLNELKCSDMRECFLLSFSSSGHGYYIDDILQETLIDLILYCVKINLLLYNF